jgi:hypothetical protein
MGRTATCAVRVGTRSFKAQVDLETDEIIVRGTEGFRLKFSEIHETAAIKAGKLLVGDKKRSAELDLGTKEAQVWLHKVKSPPSRVDKLGIKQSSRLALVGEIPADLREEIEREGATIVQGGTVSLVMLGAESRRELGQLDVLREWISPAGGIWIIREKDNARLTEKDVHAAAKAAKLVAIKVARLSDRYTADKLVIPRKDR